MAKKAAKAVSRKKSAAKKKTARTGKSNIEILVTKGALDPGAASRLDPSVVRRINKYTKRDVQFLITHQLKLCGMARPAPDGSFF